MRMSSEAELLEEAIDAYCAAVAARRLAEHLADPRPLLNMEDVLRELGLTRADLEGAPCDDRPD